MEQVKIKVYKRNFRYRVKMNLNSFKVYTYTSIIGAGTMFLTLFILTSILKMHYLISFVIAYVLFTIFSFALNKFWTFKGFNPKRIHRQYYESFIVGILAFIANFVFLYILTDLIGLWYLLSQLVISLIGLPLFYLVNKKLVFSHI